VDVNPGSTQGSQYGDGNIQINAWQTGRQLDPASLGELNPDKAAEYIGDMPHDDAVLLLAKADVNAAAAPLDVMLKTDEARAVLLLTSLSRSRAEAVIAVLAADVAGREWLGDLPEATAATGKRAAELKLAAPGPLKSLREAFPGTASGYLRTYRNGQVCWRRPPFTAPQALAITGVILDHYVRSGGISGRFGFPQAEERPVGGADGRWVQVFSSGAIYRHETSVIEVDGPIADYLFASTDGYHRYPLGPAVVHTPQPPSRSWGLMQRFGGSWDSCDETVYFSEATRTCGVRGAIASYYDQLSGPSSWLGYPTTRQSDRDGRSIQDFQGGTVFVGPDQTVAAIPAASRELIRRDESIENRLGFPLTTEEPTGTGDDSWQFFQNGVVTVKDGNRQVWVRP
jgi:hypothetical protein